MHPRITAGAFEPALASGAGFDCATGADAHVIAAARTQALPRPLCLFGRGSLPPEYATAIAEWQHYGGLSADASVRIAAFDRAGHERLLRCCARDRSLWLGSTHLILSTCSTRSPYRGPGGNGAPILMLPQLLDRVAALVPPPHVHRHRCFDVLA